MKGNYTRRPADWKGMFERRKRIRAALKNEKCNNFRTSERVRRRTTSTDAMRLTADSAKGNFEANIVYIDSLSNLIPSTLNDKPYTLPEWCYLSPQAKACFYQLAAASLESQNLIAAPFSFNLSEQLWKAAATHKSPDVSYLQHRLKTALKRALNRVPDFWFAYETNHAPDNTGKPHLHGTILLAPSEYKKARDAFHQLNGKTSPDFKRYAIRFSSGARQRQTKEFGAIHVNLKWSLYCMKERGLVRFYYLTNQNTATATRPLTQAAKQYHEQIRQHQKSK